MSIPAQRRFKRDHPCPVCGGHEDLPRGKGTRCSGFLLPDGTAAVCMRRESSKQISTAAGPGWVHQLGKPAAPELRTVGNEPPPWESVERCAEVMSKNFGMPFYKSWAYKNRDGEIVAHVLRWGTGERKTYRPLSRVSGGWRMADPDGPWPMYRLDEIVAAGEEMIFVTEGEKCADAVADLGLYCTAAAHGAKSPQKTDWTPLEGRRVCILPDNDDPGADYTKTVARLCYEVGTASVRIVALDGLAEKEDVVEWIERHGDTAMQDLMALAETAHEVPKPLTPIMRVLTEQKAGKNQTPSLPWEQLNQTRALKAGTVFVFGGPAGYGKTLAGMNMATHLHDQGVAWKYLPLEDSKLEFGLRVLAYLAMDWSVLDDTPDTADSRMEKYKRHEKALGSIMANVEENPRLIIPAGRDGAVPKLPPENILKWARDAFATGCRVIFIDPMAQIDFPGSQTWTHETSFVRNLVGLAQKAMGTVVLMAHTVKRPGRASTLPLCMEDLQGASALSRLTQTIVMLDAHEEKEHTVKTRFGGVQNVTYSRTVRIAKTRNGTGTGLMLAADLKSPMLNIMGMIV